MSSIRVVLCVRDLSGAALVSVVRQLTREAKWLEVSGVTRAQLETLRAHLPTRIFQRVRPVSPSSEDTVVVPALYDFSAGSIRRLSRVSPRVQVVRVYVPGTNPALAVTRWSGKALARLGGDVSCMPDFHKDDPRPTVDDGHYRSWVRGEDIGIYGGPFRRGAPDQEDRRPLDQRLWAWRAGIVLESRDLWQKQIRSRAGRLKRALRRA